MSFFKTFNKVIILKSVLLEKEKATERNVGNNVFGKNITFFVFQGIILVACQNSCLWIRRFNPGGVVNWWFWHNFVRFHET